MNDALGLTVLAGGAEQLAELVVGAGVVGGQTEHLTDTSSVAADVGGCFGAVLPRRIGRAIARAGIGWGEMCRPRSG